MDRPIPSHHNSGCRPRRKVQHWTQKGDCKVTGDGERNQLQFYEENPYKNEWTQIIENRKFACNFIYEIPFKMNQTYTKVHQQIEIAFNLLKGNL